MFCNTIYSCNLPSAVLSPAPFNPALYYSCCLVEHTANTHILRSSLVRAHWRLFNINSTFLCVAGAKNVAVVLITTTESCNCTFHKFTQDLGCFLCISLDCINIQNIALALSHVCVCVCADVFSLFMCAWEKAKRRMPDFVMRICSYLYI